MLLIFWCFYNCILSRNLTFLTLGSLIDDDNEVLKYYFWSMFDVVLCCTGRWLKLSSINSHSFSQAIPCKLEGAEDDPENAEAVQKFCEVALGKVLSAEPDPK